MVPCYTIKRAFLRGKKTKNLCTAYLQAIPPKTGKAAEVFCESSNSLMNILSDSKWRMGALIKLYKCDCTSFKMIYRLIPITPALLRINKYSINLVPSVRSGSSLWV